MRSGFVFSAACALVFCACGSDPVGVGIVPAGNPGTENPGATPPAAPPASATPLGKTNGTLGDWQTLAAMPLPRANHCATFANGYLVVIGGNYKPKGSSNFKSIADVHVAKVNDDGSLGEWKVGGTLPSAVNSCTAASDGKRVLVLDGIFDRDTDGKKVWAAALGDDGTLAPFASIGDLPANARVLYSNAWVEGATLLATRAKLTTEGDAVSLLRAPLAEKVGTWTESDWLQGFRGHPLYAFSGKFVYTIGGYKSEANDLPMQSDVNGAPIDGSMAPGAVFSTAALPKVTGFGSAVAADGYLYVVGGKDEVYSGKGRTDVFSAKIKDDGTVDAWTAQAAMPQGRTNHAAVIANNYLYVTGGGYDAGGLDNVYVAKIRF